MFGIHFDRHTLGNLVKNISPAAGLLGGPLGFAAAGGLSALGDLGRGKKPSIKNALTNATLGSGLHAAKGMLSGGTHAASGAAAAVPPAPVPTGGLPLPPAPTLTSITEKAIDPRNLIQKVGDHAGGVFDWASEHPNAAAGALQGVGNLATAGAQNRTQNAQADMLEKQAEETDYDFQRRKARDAQLAPVWSSLGNTIGNSYAGVAANPYLPKVS